MQRIAAARRGAFLVVLASAVIFAIALFRLPEEFVADLKRDRPLDLAAAGWLYRLLALAAVAQAAYVGLSVLRPEKVRSDRLQDPRSAAASPEKATRTVARNAAGAAALTLIYGVGAFILTGERGGMWLFLLIFAAQMGWNYRQTGLASRLFVLDAEPDDEGALGSEESLATERDG